VSYEVPQSDENLCRPPALARCAASAARGDPDDLVRKTAYFGAWMLLLSIVTAARAKALPDRLAAVFIVMLE